MKRPKLSIRVRLTLWYGLLLTIMLLLFSGGLYWLLARNLSSQVDANLVAAAVQTNSTIEYEAGRLHLQNSDELSPMVVLKERSLSLRLLDATGQVLESSGSFGHIPPLTAPLPAAPVFTTFKQVDDDEAVRIYSLPYRDQGQIYGYIQVAQSLEPLRQTMDGFVLILLIATPIMVVIASFGGLFLAQRALAPIDQMTRTVQRISAEDLSQRLNLPAPHDEVGRLATTFDNMLARLERAFQQQRQFAADASHELRTPLASIKGNIEVTLARARAASEYQQVLISVDEEVDRLTRVVHDLLLLTRNDAGTLLLEHDQFDLSALLYVALDCVQALAETKQHTLHVDVPASLPWQGDADKLLRVFINLLDNAVAYTPPGGQITLAVRATQSAVIVDVTDTGYGIAAEHVPHIFERFYRADDARSRQTGGSGLGLAIAHQIVIAHGGQINVNSTPQVGSSFQVILPRSPRIHG